MPSDMAERVETLERHVLGVDREQPGLLMRLDRLEWFVKALIFLGGLNVIGDIATSILKR